MEELAKADVFFLITSVAVVLVTVGVLTVLYYLYRTVKNIKELSETLKSSGEVFVDELHDESSALRAGVRKYGSKAGKVLMFALGEYVKKKTTSSKKKSSKKKDQ
jgi:hypothetical protein